MQDRFKEFSKIHKDVLFTNDIQNLNKLTTKNCLVILDDMMMECEGARNAMVTEFFIKGSHHRLISVILILQVVLNKIIFLPHKLYGINYFYRMLFPEN